MSSAPDLTSRVLRHQRALVAGSLGALALVCWWYVAAVGASASAMGMTAAQRPGLGALVLMWWLMMVAMMLPSAAPAILLYARVREIRGRDADIAETWVFLAGYLGVWLLFSIAAALAQAVAIGSATALDHSIARGAVLLVIGVYQLSPLKNACLSECRSPATFISRHWRPGRERALLLGVRHGVYCLGCCWMLMALLFVGGVMNLLWILALTLLVGIEKLASRGPLIGRVAGVGLIVWGLATLAIG